MMPVEKTTPSGSEAYQSAQDIQDLHLDD